MEKDQTLRKRVFIDTNILLSGVFFTGNESRLLSLIDLDLFASDLVVAEAKEVIRRKFESFGAESAKVALEELEHALMDFTKIINETEYALNLKIAKKLINKEKDAKILAAVLAINPDYFITGDADFDNPQIREVAKLSKTREVLRVLGFV